MADTPLYPEDYDRDYWIEDTPKEWLFRILRGNCEGATEFHGNLRSDFREIWC